jgi:hypothetical protein
MRHFPEIESDGRKKPARRWHKLFSQFLAHTGKFQGRHAEMDRAAAKRAATLSVMLEKMDSALLRGEQINPEAYSRTSNSLERVLCQLGVMEDPKPDPLKTLQAHIAKKESGQ